MPWRIVSNVVSGIFNKGRITLEIENQSALRLHIPYMFLAVSRSKLSELIAAYAELYSPLMRDKI